MTKKELNELAAVIDGACDHSDEKELKLITLTLEEYVKNTSNFENESIFYYYLSNAWSGLKDIKHNNQDTIWQYEQIEVFKAIYYLRKSISGQDFKDLNPDLKISILTNLGNAFSHYGRPINAIKYYNMALSLNTNYFMSLTNKAICLETYSNLVYDDSHKALFLRYAYFDFIESNKEILLYFKNYEYDYSFYKNINNYNNKHINKIEKILSIDWLKEEIDLNKFEMRKFQKERKYRNWVLDNTLFLNPMNDLGKYSIATQDVLNLPNLRTDIEKGFPKFITYFNQIKQEYISYRYLLYEGINCPTNCYYDKDTSIADDYDYNIYDINTEKIKLSYRGFYSLFDKIAYFLNEYLELGKDKQRINFKNIWNKNNQLDKLENLALRGLYLISKDLYFNENKDEEIFTPLEPEADKINKIRNHLEHKFIMIKHLNTEHDESFFEREKIFSITEEELIEKTLHLAKVSRESIMYLSFAIHSEEMKKKDDERYLNISLSTIK